MTGQSSFFFDLPADRQDDLIQAKKNTLSSPAFSLEETESEEDLGSPPSDYVRGNQQMDLLFGPFVTGLMNREDINEIYVNDDGFIWYDSYKEGKVKTKEYLSPKRIRSIIEFIAGRQGKIVNDDIPSLSAEIAGYGSRFQGELPPIVRHPQFNIRKKALQIFTLDDYVHQGVLSPYHKAYLCEAIKERKNILIVGGTGTGKTTFLNALLDSIAKITPYHRIISIEDLPELQCSAEDYSPMFTKQDTGKDVIRYNMTKLVEDCMRRSPDRIVLGEVRNGAAFSMLKAWNTGHPGGCCTVHANSAIQGLTRIKSLAEENKDAAGGINNLIGEAIDVVVCISHTDPGNGRRGRIIQEVIAVDSYDEARHRFIYSVIPRDGQ